MLKECSKCKIKKDLFDFYKDKRAKDGLYSSCKKCHIKNKKWAKSEDGKKYQKKYQNKYHKRKKWKEYYKRYCLNPEFKKYLSNYHTEYQKKNSFKYLCRQQTNFLLRVGIIKKRNCIICGDKKSEAHHIDYTKPKKVIWLCKKHHCELHKKLNFN